MMMKHPKDDPTKDPKFQGVVDHFLKTPPKPREKPKGKGGKVTSGKKRPPRN